MIRNVFLACIIVFFSLISAQTPANAFIASATKDGVSQTAKKLLKEGKAAMAPYGHVKFCVKNPQECVMKTSSQAPDDPESLQQLHRINSTINAAITPKQEQGAIDTWNIAPKTGDCDDYAITKRHQLLAQGWPSSALRLAVAAFPGTEDHLVLIVRSGQTDYVLDNLQAAVKPWHQTGYRWKFIQTSDNPKLWAQVEI